MKKFLLLMLVMLAGISSCKKSETPAVDNGLNIKTFVIAENGLVLRSAPDSTGKDLAMVPYKEELIIIKYSDMDAKVGNALAPWAFVRFKNLEGWVFAGSLGGLQKGNYKNHDLNQLIKEVSAKHYKTLKTSSGEEVTINTPDQVKVLEINGDFAIIQYMCDGCMEYRPEAAQALWYFKDGKWNDFDVVKILGLEDCPSSISVKLAYINNDEYIDVAFEGGVSDGSTAKVYLYDGTNLKEVIFSQDGETSFRSTAPCGSSEISSIYYDRNGEKSTLRFNCRTGKFE